ncbi:MAG: hypothetical protein JO187_12350 [Acidobacteria bacterium]|nr:hypothetical protein [Acidobacteriota bacterium]
MPTMAHVFHSVVPLGQDGLLLQPSKRSLILIASAQSSAFDGWQKVEGSANRIVDASTGHPVHRFPAYVDFRVTASTRRDGYNMGEPLYPTPCNAELDQYLLGLRFRLKIFHGLETRSLEPQVVRLVGVPAEVPYDERVYQVSFKLENVPVEDKVVLEVLSPEGQRISKFHLEF